MLPLLQNLHLIAAKRGDGLRPEFLKAEAEAPLSIVFPTLPSKGVRLQVVASLTPGRPERLPGHAAWHCQVDE
ncbi:hypothetical protein X743_11525 [Mesorhizobium sp. LNHC252B00]|uniref:hypothetical protein n=1 Tax=Mesorhizobium sp. LNHC252B00 TaxID=1287252 RepID=UPI0003CF9995|nr:hypothetical protein [Mesorhizobium sp. LNHC252B00]ESY73531.1 hypothetical protein X743_11525 [Mesorhizobium sp. LNHC252B00]